MIINIDKAYLLPNTGIYVKAEVSGEEYFSDITISRLNIYKDNETTPIATCELPEGTKAFAKLLDFTFFRSNVLSSFNSNIFRVELIPEGTVGLDTPCGEDKSSVSTYVINDYAIYKASKVFGRDFCGNCNCSIPRKAINFILNYSLLRKAIDYNQYRLLNTWYRDFQLRYVRKIAGYKVSKCGCNSVNIDDIFNMPIEPKMPKCGCGGDSSLEGLVSYYDTLCGNGTISLDKTFCNLVAELFYILDRLGADIETVTKSATGGSYEFIVGPTGDGGGSTPVDPDDPDTPVVPVESITLNRSAITVPIGTTFTLTPTILPANATDKTVTWTSDNSSIAVVSSGGQVVGMSLGETRVIATCGSQVAVCNVTVTAVVVDVDSITLSPTSTNVKVGQSVTLTATVTPNNATDPTVTWASADTSIATVNSNGVVTGVDVGVVEVIATAGAKTARCIVTVYEDAVVSTSFNITIRPAANLHELDANPNKSNHTKQFEVAFYNTAQLDEEDFSDLEANAITSWSSSNTNVFTVNSSTGEVTAVGNGEASLTAISTYDSYSATATTRVRVTTSPDVTNISVTPQTWAATLGVDLYQALTVTATYSDTTSGEINKHDNIDFTSSDTNVARVTEYGMVWAVGAGTATITATLKDDNSITDTMTVTVTAPAPSTDNAHISINWTKNTIEVGEQTPISVTVSPLSLTDEPYTLTLSDTSVATINSNNIITGIAVGTCEITATLDSNPNVMDSFVLQVINNNVTVDIIDKVNASANLIEGQNRTISAGLGNSDGVGVVNFGSSDTSVITISDVLQDSSTGISSCLITAVSVGTSRIRAEYSNNPSIHDYMDIMVEEDLNGEFVVTPSIINLGNGEGGSSTSGTVYIKSTDQDWVSVLYDDYDTYRVPATSINAYVTKLWTKDNAEINVGQPRYSTYYGDIDLATTRPVASNKPVIANTMLNETTGNYRADVYIPLDGVVKIDLDAILEPQNATDPVEWHATLDENLTSTSTDVVLTPDSNDAHTCTITPYAANCEFGYTGDNVDGYTPTATMLSGKYVTRVYITCGNLTSKSVKCQIYIYVYDPSAGGGIGGGVRP